MRSEAYYLYKRALLIFLGISALLTIFTVYGINIMIESLGDSSRMDLTPLAPVRGGWGGLSVLLFVIPVSASLGTLIGGYTLAPLYLFLHKTFFKRMIYGIQKAPQKRGFRQMFKGLYPALLAVNINSIILFSSPDLLNRILVPGLLLDDVDFAIRYALGSIVLSMLTVGLGMLVFSPSWSLMDAGVVYSNQERVQGTGRPVDRSIDRKIAMKMGITKVAPAPTL